MMNTTQNFTTCSTATNSTIHSFLYPCQVCIVMSFLLCIPTKQNKKYMYSLPLHRNKEVSEYFVSLAKKPPVPK
jgi:hypothetical protein